MEEKYRGWSRRELAGEMVRLIEEGAPILKQLEALHDQWNRLAQQVECIEDEIRRRAVEDGPEAGGCLPSS